MELRRWCAADAELDVAQGGGGLQDAHAVPWKQLGLQQLARGAAWAEFQQDFKQHNDKGPSLLACAGFDTARLLALADAAASPLSADGGIDAMD